MAKKTKEVKPVKTVKLVDDPGHPPKPTTK